MKRSPPIEEIPAGRRPRARGGALRQTAAEFAAEFGASYRRSKLIDREIEVLLDIEDHKEMLHELTDLLAQEDEHFAEDFARACKSKLRWAQSVETARRRREADAAVVEPATSSPRDLASAFTDAFERALSTDVERVELLLKATRRHSVHRARRLRRSLGD